MEYFENITCSSLELCNYRYLQQLAKSVHLPCNVKKSQLIELLRAKKYCTPQELHKVIVRIKEERNRLIRARRLAKSRIDLLQSSEISSTSKHWPFTRLRKPGDNHIEYTSSFHQKRRYRGVPTISSRATRFTGVYNSRLRASCKTVNNSDIELSQSDRPQHQYHNMYSQREVSSSEHLINARRSFNKGKNKQGHSVIDQVHFESHVQSTDALPIPATRNSDVHAPRAETGGHMLTENATVTQSSVLYLQSIDVKHKDGYVSKVLATVEKSSLKTVPRSTKQAMQLRTKNTQTRIGINNQSIQKTNTAIFTRQNTRSKTSFTSKRLAKGPDNVTVQDLVNYKIDQRYFNNSSTSNARKTKLRNTYQNKLNKNNSAMNKRRNNNCNSNTGLNCFTGNANCAFDNSLSFWDGDTLQMINDKYFTEEVDDKVLSDKEIFDLMNDEYPNISGLNDTKTTSSIIDSLCENPNILSHYTPKDNRGKKRKAQRPSTPKALPKNVAKASYINIDALKKIYKNNQLLANQSLKPNNLETILIRKPIMSAALYVPTYLRESICSRMDVQESPAVRNAALYSNQTQNSQLNTNRRCPHFFDNPKDAEKYLYGEDITSSNTSKQLSSKTENFPYPEQLEDAYDIISQDGDYMERIGIDATMQCVLCQWAGPKIDLTQHIREVHSNKIVEQTNEDWTIKVPLEGTSPRVVLYDEQLFYFHVTYKPQYVIISLYMLPSLVEVWPKYSCLTVYNIVTDKLHKWEGELAYLPNSTPYDTGAYGLKLDINELLQNNTNETQVNKVADYSTANVENGNKQLKYFEVSVHVKILHDNESRMSYSYINI